MTSRPATCARVIWPAAARHRRCLRAVLDRPPPPCADGHRWRLRSCQHRCQTLAGDGGRGTIERKVTLRSILAGQRGCGRGRDAAPPGRTIRGLPVADQQRCFPASAYRRIRSRCSSHPGSAVSPVLANLFLHYAFDTWMARKFPSIRFERYVDDVVVHGRSQRQARMLQTAVGQRLAEVGLTLHPANRTLSGRRLTGRV